MGDAASLAEIPLEISFTISKSIERIRLLVIYQEARVAPLLMFAILLCLFLFFSCSKNCRFVFSSVYSLEFPSFMLFPLLFKHITNEVLISSIPFQIYRCSFKTAYCEFIIAHRSDECFSPLLNYLLNPA